MSQFQGQGTYIRMHFGLVDGHCSLWKKGNKYPPQGSHTLQLPFRFKLPDILPPSCDYPCYLAGSQGRATVRYFVELVAKRSGLHRNRRISSIFPVLPRDAAGAFAHTTLILRGWPGTWRRTQTTKEIRKGFYGDHSRVEVTVSRPAV